jgi:glucan phosphoethanolaminetransferase (alkaline phosphatase superfamily)
MALHRLRFTPSAITFIGLTAALNALLYHLPLLSFAAVNLDLSSFTGVLTLATLLVALLSASVLLLTLPALISQRLLQPFSMSVALTNAVAVYFVATYHVVLDETMMGNVLNTDFAEDCRISAPDSHCLSAGSGRAALLASCTSSDPRDSTLAPRCRGPGLLIDYRDLVTCSRPQLALVRRKLEEAWRDGHAVVVRHQYGKVRSATTDGV